MVKSVAVRARLLVSGTRVQKVGYRDFVEDTALHMRVVGIARNLPDGRVEVVCEAPRPLLEQFAKAIEIHRFPIDVKSVEVGYSKATGEFTDFDIEWEPDLARATFERMASGAEAIRELSGKVDNMSGTLSGKIDGLGTKIDHMGSTLSGKIDNLGTKMDRVADKTDQVGKKVDAMRTEVAGSFTRMEERYGEIGKNLAVAVGLLATVAEKFEAEHVEMGAALKELTAVLREERHRDK